MIMDTTETVRPQFLQSKTISKERELSRSLALYEDFIRERSQHALQAEQLLRISQRASLDACRRRRKNAKEELVNFLAEMLIALVSIGIVVATAFALSS